MGHTIAKGDGIDRELDGAVWRRQELTVEGLYVRADVLAEVLRAAIREAHADIGISGRRGRGRHGSNRFVPEAARAHDRESQNTQTSHEHI
jgi:hypothetical protein